MLGHIHCRIQATDEVYVHDVGWNDAIVTASVNEVFWVAFAWFGGVSRVGAQDRWWPLRSMPITQAGHVVSTGMSASVGAG